MDSDGLTNAGWLASLTELAIAHKRIFGRTVLPAFRDGPRWRPARSVLRPAALLGAALLVVLAAGTRYLSRSAGHR